MSLHLAWPEAGLWTRTASIFFDMMLLVAGSSTCAVSGGGRVSFLSSFVISFMPTTVYFWHIPSLYRSRSSIGFQMRHTGLASRLASRRLRSCFSKICPKSILNLSQVNPKIQFTRAQLYHKYPALKQNNIFSIQTRYNVKIPKLRENPCVCMRCTNHTHLPIIPSDVESTGHPYTNIW